MRITYLADKNVPALGPPTGITDPKFSDAGGPVTAAQRPNSVTGIARTAGLSSPDPRHPRFTAISWVVLQEVKHDAAAALLRLELVRRQHPEPAIARATEFLRCAVGELEALASGESES